MVNKNPKFFESLFYMVLIGLVILLFHRFSKQNMERIQEQNQTYAQDSVRQIAWRIDDQLKNALELIKTYAYFIENSLHDPEVTVPMLAEWEKTSPFDGLRFTNPQGMNYSSEGGIVDMTDREFYLEGMKGKSGIAPILLPRRLNKPILGFYTPIHYEGKIVGVLHGSYLSDTYLRSMLKTSYFGYPSDVFLCQTDGEIIASSSGEKYSGNILDVLQKDIRVNDATLKGVSKVFQKGGEGIFSCNENSNIDNLCVIHLPQYNFVLVQTFPQIVTTHMVENANLVGIQLEVGLFCLFVVYVAWLLMRARNQKKKLEKENREFATLFKGLDILFSSHYGLANLETGQYKFIVSSNSSEKQNYDTYEQFIETQARSIIGKEKQQDFLDFFQDSHLEQIFENQNTVTYESHILVDGRPEWENVIATCLERKDGKPVKILFLRQNVTEMKQRELQTKRKLSAMNRKERQYRLAATSNALCSFEFNVSRDLLQEDIVQRIEDEEISWLNVVGLSAPCKASEVFNAWRERVLPESREEYARVMNVEYLRQEFANGNLEVDLDFWVDDPEGMEICIRHAVYLSQDDFTGDLMALAVARDITNLILKHRSQTKALQDALMLAQHANEAKTTFLSNMSHDIRTPMNAIIGFATIAASHLDNREQVRDCLQKVLSSSNHLLSLINDILDMSRIESGKMQVKEQECNISELMHNLVNIIQPQVKAKQMQLFIDTFEVVNEDVVTDPLKLNQVFINLLGNAVKYTPAGGTISFRLTQKPAFRHGYAEYVFVVRDNGIGMDAKFLERIFEPFTRENTSTKSGIQGTGLGMAITKNIIEILNGHIEVQSEPGKGSTFTVTFTLKLQETVNTQTNIKELEGLRALVVDDDFHVCDSVSKMLKKIGLRPEWTTSGREAATRAMLAHNDKDPFHTYIIDWQMPDLNGVETTRRIRQIVGKDASIIILTAYEWADIEEEAHNAGVTAFCAKPLFMSDLKNALLSSHNLIEKTPPPPPEAPAFKNARIMVVDDLDMNREIAEFILTENGFEVEFAPDGTDAVEMVRKSPENYYSAILMDVQMPTMNGYEATKIIRNLEREDVRSMPIIAMTANALEEDKAEALKSGMNDHISKPIDINKFFEVLGKYFK